MIDRDPVASVGVVWAQQNVDFYGRDNALTRAILPYRGVVQALIRARIPYLPVHADHVDRDSRNLSLLILPNLAAMSDSQLGMIRRFLESGGSLIATGETSLCDEWGDPRADFGLAEWLGVRSTGSHVGPNQLSSTEHSYLRLLPDLGLNVYGPRAGEEPALSLPRHAVLDGFESTNILPFGGRLEGIQVDSQADVLLTLIPAFPIYPPETSWMRETRTDLAALVVRTLGNGSRIAYLSADIDRKFAQHNLPDHGDLLANLFKWAAKDSIPLKVDGPGLVDCQLYRQADLLILHLVNLTSAGTWRSPVHELIPVGPLSIELRLPNGIAGRSARTIVSEHSLNGEIRDGWCHFELDSIFDHEVAIIS